MLGRLCIPFLHTEGPSLAHKHYQNICRPIKGSQRVRIEPVYRECTLHMLHSPNAAYDIPFKRLRRVVG